MQWGWCCLPKKILSLYLDHLDHLDHQTKYRLNQPVNWEMCDPDDQFGDPDDQFGDPDRFQGYSQVKKNMTALA